MTCARWWRPGASLTTHVPVTPETKPAAEEKQLDLLRGQVDAVVLARYMQVLSPAFLAAFPMRAINIHHSFLPAFVGADPYGKAAERGVKLIGATAHYVTAELDAGPIIEQDVVRDRPPPVGGRPPPGRPVRRAGGARTCGRLACGGPCHRAREQDHRVQLTRLPGRIG